MVCPRSVLIPSLWPMDRTSRWKHVVEKASGLTIKIAGQESFNLPVREPVKLTAQHAEVRGLAESPFQEQ